MRRAQHLPAVVGDALQHRDQGERRPERQSRLGLVEAVEAGLVEPGAEDLEGGIGSRVSHLGRYAGTSSSDDRDERAGSDARPGVHADS